ncbi:hypothetical protein J1N35_010272 [Gossypium stocksii]|uniref:Uncharacterized protein n=1 Tax=Gossypium stocksii TaxID=47602 RepID=A0A9D3W033_9ROSI|nr:hypothetical protein J1N35_010272 [Gossypium stocksii]
MTSVGCAAQLLSFLQKGKQFYPTLQKIKDAYADITEKSKLSSCAAHPKLVMFYTTIKEMDEVRELKEVNISKLRVWKDAIYNALRINMEVEFAKEHLTKIAHAYFASKTVGPKNYDQKKKLEAELGQLGRISTMLELHEICQSEATFFNDTSLLTRVFSRNLYLLSMLNL